ncbi:hypothetical protein GWI33_023248, partial [Rhynchophorus ferrugineus]
DRGHNLCCQSSVAAPLKSDLIRHVTYGNCLVTSSLLYQPMKRMSRSVLEYSRRTFDDYAERPLYLDSS